VTDEASNGAVPPGGCQPPSRRVISSSSGVSAKPLLKPHRKDAFTVLGALSGLLSSSRVRSRTTLCGPRELMIYRIWYSGRIGAPLLVERCTGMPPPAPPHTTSPLPGTPSLDSQRDHARWDRSWRPETHGCHGRVANGR